jgi:hypothetical protein
MIYSPLNIIYAPWHELDEFNDRTIFQTLSWLNFLVDSQDVQPILAKICFDNSIIGYFTCCLFKKFGLKILGSPFKGWTTSYMGFNFSDANYRRQALQVLPTFVFNELGCIHAEIIDPHLNDNDFSNLGYNINYFHNLEIDLTKNEDYLFSKMHKKSCRWCIRKAENLGVTIEIAEPQDFADTYYSQLKDVFAKQGLVPTYGIDRVHKLIKHIYPTGNLLLLKALSPNGKCIATGIFPAFNDTMYFWGAASWRQFQKYRPNEILIWHAMKYWKSRDVLKFDMGGFAEYKRKYGGQEIFIPRLMISRFKYLSTIRNIAQLSWKTKQKLLGILK